VAYPATPDGWTEVSRSAVGPFTTHVVFRKPDGALADWSSRLHRKRASLLSRAHAREGVWWAPGRVSWWIGVLFAIGSTCFLVGPFPGLVELIGSAADAVVFFVGSIFFTTAAALQLMESSNVGRRPGGRFRPIAFVPGSADWWSSAIQFAGTLLFNRSTFRAMSTGLDEVAYDKLVWSPDAFGSICFLVSGALACAVVRGQRGARPWWMAWVNFAGCVAFGVSAVAAYVVPSTGSAIDLAASNAFTSLGGLCFLIGALMLLPEPGPAAHLPAAEPR
jgi:hypothetical protein